MVFLFDPFSLCVVFLSWLLLLFANIVTCRYVFVGYFDGTYSSYGFPPTFAGRAWFLFYEILHVLTWISHVMAMLTDPGRLGDKAPWNPPEEVEDPNSCTKCGGRWKPPRAHHCRTCQTCIYRMDHHCPWINNCVGLGNQKVFILLLLYGSILAAVNLFLFGLAIYYWLIYGVAPANEVGVLLGTLAALECLMLGGMTVDLLSQQYESVETNSTLIESYRFLHGTKTSMLAQLVEIAGPPTIGWLLPYTPKLNVDYTDPVVPDSDHLQDLHKLPLRGNAWLPVSPTSTPPAAHTTEHEYGFSSSARLPHDLPPDTHGDTTAVSSTPHEGDTTAVSCATSSRPLRLARLKAFNHHPDPSDHSCVSPSRRQPPHRPEEAMEVSRYTASRLLRIRPPASSPRPPVFIRCPRVGFWARHRNFWMAIAMGTSVCLAYWSHKVYGRSPINVVFNWENGIR